MDVQSYWEYAQVRKRPKTVELERRAWHSYKSYAFTRHDSSEATVEAWHRWMVSTGSSKTTANIYLRHLHAVYEGLQRLGLTQGNLASGVPQFRQPRRAPDFLSRSEASRLVRACDGNEKLYRLLLLCLYAGLRKGEALNLTWPCIDFERRLLTVRNSDGFQTKSGLERSVPVAGCLLRALQSRREQTGYIVPAGMRGEASGVYRYDPKKSFHLVRTRAGVPRANFILLRHTFASWLAQEGVSIFKVSKWLGHSSVKVTEVYYAGLYAYDAEIDRLTEV